MQIAQGCAHIAHRVQHVGPDDEVECISFKFLVGARFFEIENLEFHFRKCRQLLRCAGEKRGRDVAEDVGMQVALEERQDL
jgi:hypothetical protein